MDNALKSYEWQRILVVKDFKVEIQKVGQNNSAILQNCFPPEIRSRPFLNFWKFESSEKDTPESGRMN